MSDEHQPTAASETHGAPQHDAHLSDTVVLLGRTITVPGGIYTIVFIGLGVLTVVEVALGLISGSWTIPLLLAIATSKAALVVLYYMHLRTDSRLFALTLAIPLGLALLSVLYLLAVPPTGYQIGP